MMKFLYMTLAMQWARCGCVAVSGHVPLYASSVALWLWNWKPRFGVSGPKLGADGGAVCQLAPHVPLGS